MVRYENNLSIPFIVGLWSLFSMISSLILVISFIVDQQTLSSKISRIIFYDLFYVSTLLILISTPAVMFKKDWGRIALSIGFLLNLTNMLFFAFWIIAGDVDSLITGWEGVLFIITYFILPFLPVFLMLQSQHFIYFFRSKNQGGNNRKILMHNKLSIPLITGIWCICGISIYIYLGFYALTHGKIFSNNIQYNIIITIFGVVILGIVISSIAMMFKNDLGRKALSCVLHLGMCNILYSLFIYEPGNMRDSIMNLCILLQPLFLPGLPILLMIHSKQFVAYFKSADLESRLDLC